MMSDMYGLQKLARGLSRAEAVFYMGQMKENPYWWQDPDLMAMYRIWEKKFGENFDRDLDEDFDEDFDGDLDQDFDQDFDQEDLSADVEEILGKVKKWLK